MLARRSSNENKMIAILSGTLPQQLRGPAWWRTTPCRSLKGCLGVPTPSLGQRVNWPARRVEAADGLEQFLAVRVCERGDRQEGEDLPGFLVALEQRRQEAVFPVAGRDDILL